MSHHLRFGRAVLPNALDGHGHLGALVVAHMHASKAALADHALHNVLVVHRRVLLKPVSVLLISAHTPRRTALVDTDLLHWRGFRACKGLQCRQHRAETQRQAQLHESATRSRARQKQVTHSRRHDDGALDVCRSTLDNE